MGLIYYNLGLFVVQEGELMTGVKVAYCALL